MSIGCFVTRRWVSSFACIVSLLVAAAPRISALDRQVIQNFDDQDDGVPPLGWIVGEQGGALGAWQVEAGELSIEGPGAGTGTGGREVWIWYDRSVSGDITIEWNVRWQSTPAGDVGRHGGIAFFARSPGTLGSRYAGMSGYTIDWIDRASDHGVRLHKWTNGAETGLLPDGLFTEPDPPELWRVEIRGDVISIFLDDQFFQEVTDFDYREGYIGFYQWENNVHVHYDNLIITNPDLVVARDVPADLTNGKSGTVKLSVYPYLAGNVSVREDLPAGLTPSNASNGGTVAGQTVTWNLGAIPSELVELTYTMSAAPAAIDTLLGGSATHNNVPYPIAGDTVYRGSPVTELGFIKLWNHLGPLAFVAPPAAADHGPPCDGTNTDLTLDWIVNEAGDVTEATVAPFPGRITRPAYGGDGLPNGTGARAAGLVIGAGDTGRVVQDQVPAWKGSLSPTDTIDHASVYVHGFDAEDHLTMSQVWVTNTTGAAIDTMIGVGSDDAIQVFLDDVDLTAGGVFLCRGWGVANEEQNTFPVSLPPGESRLLVKVTDGCCGSGFRLRFQNPSDPFAPGLLPPDILLSLESSQNPAPATATRDIVQASYSQGEQVDVSITVTARQAGASVEIREVLPEGATAASISDGGVLAGGDIVWNLTGVSTKTVTYKLVAAACNSTLAYGTQSSWKIAGVEGVIGGDTTAARNPLASPDLAAWDSIDIGTTGGGAEALGDHAVVVSGGGGGIKLREDQFRFVHTPASGDFSLTARIDCFDDPGRLGQVGLMVRDTVDVHSAHAFLGLSADTVTGLWRLVGATRRETNPQRIGGTIVIAADQREVSSLPIWLRLRRAEGRINLERSSDGTTFTLAGSRVIGPGTQEVSLPDGVLIGLVATGNGGGRADATFSEVSGPPFTGGALKPRFHRGDADANNSLQLTDAVRILGFLFLGGDAPTCLDSGDSDDNGVLQLTDAVRILGFLFLGQAPPAPPGAPGEACGEDPTDDDALDCVSYPPCS